MHSSSRTLEAVYLFFVPIIIPYLVLRRVFRQFLGQGTVNRVFQSAKIATTADFLRLLGVPLGLRTWIDVRKRFGFERQVSEVLMRVNGGTFADVGASLGYYSVLLSRNFRKVLAFEPHPDNIKAMREMLRVAHLSNISVVPFAVSDSNGEATLHLGTFSATHSLFKNRLTRDAGIQVRTVMIDSVVKETLDLMKIDVEGAEWHVLRGAENMIRHGRILRLLIEFHDGKMEEMEKYLTERGYSAKWIDNVHVFAERI